MALLGQDLGVGQLGQQGRNLAVPSLRGVLVRIAACGVEWPNRAISSASDAPVAAASTAPLWRRSCQDAPLVTATAPDRCRATVLHI